MKFGHVLCDSSEQLDPLPGMLKSFPAVDGVQLSQLLPQALNHGHLLLRQFFAPFWGNAVAAGIICWSSIKARLRSVSKPWMHMGLDAWTVVGYFPSSHLYLWLCYITHPLCMRRWRKSLSQRYLKYVSLVRTGWILKAKVEDRGLLPKKKNQRNFCLMNQMRMTNT